MKARVILLKRKKWVSGHGTGEGAVKYLPLSHLGVGEDATVRSRDGSVEAVHSLEGSGASGLDALHGGAGGLLFDVLNRELATWGLHFSEAV